MQRIGLVRGDVAAPARPQHAGDLARRDPRPLQMLEDRDRHAGVEAARPVGRQRVQVGEAIDVGAFGDIRHQVVCARHMREGAAQMRRSSGHRLERTDFQHGGLGAEHRGPGEEGIARHRARQVRRPWGAAAAAGAGAQRSSDLPQIFLDDRRARTGAELSGKRRQKASRLGLPARRGGLITTSPFDASGPSAVGGATDSSSRSAVGDAGRPQRRDETLAAAPGP